MLLRFKTFGVINIRRINFRTSGLAKFGCFNYDILAMMTQTCYR